MPAYNGFIGPSNPLQSVIADGERTMNFYVEHVQSPSAPAQDMLLPTPGQRPALLVSGVGLRGSFEMNGRAFIVVGPTFYELFSTNTVTSRGTVAQDSNPATICSNGIPAQLFITSGGNGYLYDLNANTLTQIAALNGKATQGGMKDGYFLCFDVKNGVVYVSNLNDGSTWNTVTMFFSRSIAPDPWLAMVVGNPYIYMLGEQTSEAWYDAGNSPQPFAPILSSFMQYGTPSSFASGMTGSTLTFLSRDRVGQGIVVTAAGYAPSPISTYAMQTLIQGYARTSTIGDAELLIYQDQGHLFGVFGFPTANATLAVDLTGGNLWCERGTWNSVAGRFDAWHPRIHLSAFGQHYVGDRSTGTISVLDVTIGTEADGSAISRFRIGPPLWASSHQRIQISRFGVQVEPGLGLAAGLGSNPLMTLQVTQDGKTWGNQRTASAGPMGQYRKRVYWTRCGSSSKLWAPMVSVSDPIPWRLSGAEIDGAGFQQVQRAA